MEQSHLLLIMYELTAIDSIEFGPPLCIQALYSTALQESPLPRTMLELMLKLKTLLLKSRTLLHGFHLLCPLGTPRRTTMTLL